MSADGPLVVRFERIFPYLTLLTSLSGVSSDQPDGGLRRMFHLFRQCGVLGESGTAQRGAG